MEASQLQVLSRATLLGLLLFSMVTLVLHGIYCLRGFFFKSHPSAASSIVTPKQCLFLFSNIIVIFLATESKLFSQTRSPPSGEDDVIDVLARELAVFAPSVKDNHAAPEEILREEQGVDVAAVLMSTQQLDQCETPSTTWSMKEMPEKEGDVSLVNNEVTMEEDREEEAPEQPTDELNRRVEDFIARFNMERQLEERMMIVCF